jgi:hypothetical protein
MNGFRKDWGQEKIEKRMGSGLEYYVESEIGGHPVWPLWIEEGEEPKAKAIRRLRRLRRFVKGKNRDTIRPGPPRFIAPKTL